MEEPSSKLSCTLCQRVFKDPVITSCGVRLLLISLSAVCYNLPLNLQGYEYLIMPDHRIFEGAFAIFFFFLATKMLGTGNLFH